MARGIVVNGLSYLNKSSKKFLVVLGLSVFVGCTAHRAKDGDNDKPSNDPVVVEGGMSTGGGLLIGTAANPWFLQNTDKVSYCIDIDEKNFSVSHDAAKKVIERSVDRWKQSFSQANNSYYTSKDLQPYAPLLIATQQFAEEACSPRTDLRFQLGKLSDDQARLIPKRDNVIAIAVRAEYDTANLRGRGFIYVAANKGPLKPSAQTFSDDPWSVCDECIFEATITHELGHVFGVPHLEGDKVFLMSEKFVEIITDKVHVMAIQAEKIGSEWLDQSFPAGGIFSFPKRFSYWDCNLTKAQKFFGSSIDQKCLKLEFDNDVVTVLAASDKSGAPQKIGTISTSVGSTTESGTDNAILMRIRLPLEQNVFTKLPDTLTNISSEPKTFFELFGPGSQTRYFSGSYKSIDNKLTRSVMVRLMPNAKFEIVGDLDGLLSLIVANH